ncbi:fibronectin type III domain-containing protein [Flammeovirga aprica]|uniref:Fibronectin type-III domain-containing protein n=1 Tax=Flammeovirga aprica JL-4 TaxID=694437 RepID=A0A7X9RY50_9BACT|nr:hypothetical protein [Flammeovirga aprica]NME70876.1 hypothetical protein [Flammeovirga aprica JL-4]
MRLAQLILILLFVQTTFAQQVVVRNKPFDVGKVEVKWYIPAIKSKAGTKVFRQQQGTSNWELLTPEWILGDTSLVKPLIQNDPNMEFYTDMATTDIKLDTLDGIVWGNMLVQSFYNDQYCKLLGIYYKDNNAIEGQTYRYKVVENKSGKSQLIGISEWVTVGEYQKGVAVNEVTVERKEKELIVNWKVEEMRFFGVNIYRKDLDKNHNREEKLTDRPIMLSMYEDSLGNMVYPDEFYNDADVRENHTYAYRVEGIDFFGQPLNKSKEVVITMKDETPPLPPYNLRKGKVVAKEGKITFNWELEEDADREGMNIFRSTDIEGPFEKVNKRPLSKNIFVFSEHLTEAGFYYYYTQSFDKAGNTANSLPVMIQLDDMIPPSTPKQLQIQADTGKFVLSWAPNTENDLKGYLVFRSASASEDNYVLLTPSAIKETKYYQRMPKNVKTPYAFKIVAVDTSYNRSPYSKIVEAKLPDVTPPEAPYLLDVKEVDGRLSIHWQENTEEDLFGYHLYRKEASETDFRQWNIKLIPAQSFRYLDGRVEEGKVYEYYLKAVDFANNHSKRSEILSGQIAPESLSENKVELKGVARKKKGTAELQWSSELLTKARGVMVYRGSQENNIKPISGLLQTHNFKDKINNKSTYIYQLRIFYTTGEVVMSNKLKLDFNEK